MLCGRGYARGKHRGHWAFDLAHRDQVGGGFLAEKQSKISATLKGRGLCLHLPTCILGYSQGKAVAQWVM